MRGVTMRRSACTVILGSLLPAVAWAGAWRIADSPLLTPWAQDVDPANVLPEYPRPQMVRSEWQNLNGLWQFQAAEDGDPVPVGENLAGNILVPFPWESALSGVRKLLPSGRAWYRRTFTVAPAWDGQRILLHFGAVDWEARVYLDGMCVSAHEGGYDAFTCDITAFVKPGQQQELIVGVYDPGSNEPVARGKQADRKFDDPGGYSYCPSSGIWQTVWLEAVPQTYIEDLHIVPDVDRGEVRIDVDPAGPLGGAAVAAVVRDGSRVVATATARPHETLTVGVPEPKLWSPSSPFLYDLQVSLKRRGETIDAVESYFGMRKISLDTHRGLKRILLNDRFLFQMGPLDQGYWPDGVYTAPTDEALRWDIEQIKTFGYNMIRKHVKIEPARWYYWCDKLGVLVWQDMPHTWGQRNEKDKTQFEVELQRMVKTHWNHPSIVIWVVFNEHWGLYDPERLTGQAMQLDPSRLVTCNSGIDAGDPDIDFEAGHIRDNHHYRPPTCPHASNRRAIVNGEYGAIGYKVQGHIWDTDGPWVHHNYEGKDAATDEYENFIEQLREFKDKGGLSGAVYTQWTDVENEMNGIYTYDRKVVKLHQDRVTQANRSLWQDNLARETSSVKREAKQVVQAPHHDSRLPRYEGPKR